MDGLDLRWGVFLISWLAFTQRGLSEQFDGQDATRGVRQRARTRVASITQTEAANIRVRARGSATSMFAVGSSTEAQMLVLVGLPLRGQAAATTPIAIDLIARAALKLETRSFG